jgi:MbtH protein
VTNPFEQENAEYCVLVNDEGQYSLWPTWCEIPSGWQAVGPRGQRDVCLAYIDETWTDMRPRSLVLAMEEASRSQLEQRPS